MSVMAQQYVNSFIITQQAQTIKILKKNLNSNEILLLKLCTLQPNSMLTMKVTTVQAHNISTFKALKK
jgi:hypothetical protein